MVLSKVEHVEHLRALPRGQRLLYTLGLSLIVAAAFVGTIVLAILIAVLLFAIIGGALPTLENTIVLTVPIVIAFIAATSFSSNPLSIGQQVRQTALRAARFGLKNGFIAGVVIGVMWSIIAGLTAVRFERWDLIFRREVVIFGLALGLAISPALALYRALTSVVETLILNFITGRRNAAS